MNLTALLSDGRRVAWWGGLVLLVLGLFQRLWLWSVYAPIEYGDTGSYFRAAAVLARGSLDGYDGTRVPGYPLFVAALGVDRESVWIGQMALGIGISLLLYALTLRMTGRPAVAFIVGVLYDLIPGQFLFEANLLTETLTAFLVILSLFLVGLVRRSSGLAPGWSLLAGLAAGAAGLVRILFYPLAVWLLPFVSMGGSLSSRTRLGRAVLFAVPAAALLGGWIAWVNSSYGFLAPTTMGGYNLVQHTGVFFEYLPDEYAPMRDTYLRYRQARLAERGDQTNTIWEAIPELTRVTGLGFYDLSREMQRASLLLVREHPDLYARNVVEGWIDFWKAPVYWEPERVEASAARSLLNVWATAGRVVSLLANAAYLLLMAALVLPIRAVRGLRRNGEWMAAAGLIAFTSVLQTLLDHGDNPRFLVPLQMVVVMVVIVGIVRMIEVVRRPAEAAA
ncbi:MAG TPA: hypothetical protein VFI11_03415 [Anaerolineales bacterium]|nr:hypothetical protein [Anaerolineales bacterium]